MLPLPDAADADADMDGLMEHALAARFRCLVLDAFSFSRVSRQAEWNRTVEVLSRHAVQLDQPMSAADFVRAVRALPASEVSAIVNPALDEEAGATDASLSASPPPVTDTRALAAVSADDMCGIGREVEDALDEASGPTAAVDGPPLPVSGSLPPVEQGALPDCW